MTTETPKWAPVQHANPKYGMKTHPHYGHAICIPWEVHVAAWHVYRKRYGSHQDALRIAERGGFGENELDDFLGPSWQEHLRRRSDVV